MSPFSTINSLSKTYPENNIAEFSLIKYVKKGDNKQITGTNLSFTCLDFWNNPKAYNPNNGP